MKREGMDGWVGERCSAEYQVGIKSGEWSLIWDREGIWIQYSIVHRIQEQMGGVFNTVDKKEQLDDDSTA